MASPRAIASTTFRSLRTRNYRLYFVGQGVSLIGTWMQTIALGWLVLDLSDNSGFAVGAAIALQFLPTLFLATWGGVVADRLDKRKLLIVTQTSMGAVAAVLGITVVAGVAELWLVYALIVLFGTAQAFDNPARLAFVSELVAEDDVPNAVGLNSTTFQLARVVGPALAGVVILVLGAGPCFLVNAVSFVAPIAALLMMDARALHRGEPVAREKGQIREGLRYVWHTPELRLLLGLTLVVGVFAINFPVVLPLIAKVTFDGNAGTYSVMTIAMGMLALIGGLFVAHRAEPNERFLYVAGLGFGSAIVVASLAPSLATFVFFIAFVGGFQIIFMASCNTLVQLRSNPQMRGRVLAVYLTAVLGSTPVGGPLIGWVSQQFGPRYGLGIGGVATVVATLVLCTMMTRARGATDDTEREAQTELAAA